VADHGVERVDRPVAEQPRHAERRAPQQGSDDRVGRVLGERLDGGPGHARAVEPGGVAADEVGDLEPCGRQVVPRQLSRDRLALAHERPPADHGPRRGGRQQCALPRPAARALGHEGGTGQWHHHEAVVQHARGAVVAVRHLLDAGGEPPEARHGVQPRRVAQEAVEDEARRETGGARGRHRPVTIGSALAGTSHGRPVSSSTAIAIVSP